MFIVSRNSKCYGTSKSSSGSSYSFSKSGGYRGAGESRYNSGGIGSSSDRQTSNKQTLKQWTFEDCDANCDYNPEFSPYRKCGGTGEVVETLNGNFKTAQCIKDCHSRFRVYPDAIPDLFSEKATSFETVTHRLHEDNKNQCKVTCDNNFDVTMKQDTLLSGCASAMSGGDALMAPIVTELKAAHERYDCHKTCDKL